MAENINNAPTEGAKDNKKKRFHNKSHKKEDNYIPNAPAEVLAVTIEELELPEKTYDALKVGGVLTVGDIIKRRMTEMYKIKNIGKKDCLAILKKLQKYNVEFREELAPQGEPEKKNKEEKAPNNKRESNKKNKPEKKQREPKKEIPEEPIDKDELVKFYRKKKWGFKDYQGKEVIEPKFDEAFNFREDLACVELDEKLGYIDKTGEIAIPFMFDCALSFSEGLAAVTIGDYSGYIDKTGEYVFPLEYDVATSFFDGKAVVRKDGRWGFLNRDGSIRWK